jgi:putative membrane protein
MRQLTAIGWSLLWAGIGTAALVFTFWVIDQCTPAVDIWKEIVGKQNVALATLFGFGLLGVAIIIASAIH